MIYFTHLNIEGLHMRKAYTVVEFIFTIYIIGILALVGGTIYAAVHFIMKLW